MTNGLIEVAVVLVVVAFVILVISMVWTMIEIRRTAHQAGQFFVQLNRDVPHILNNFHGTSQNVRVIADEAKVGVTHALVLFHAVGDVGHTIGTMHNTVVWQAKRLGNRVDMVMAGMRAVFQSLHRHSFQSKNRS
ncbi:MAG: DUF948 domain-containing protein [Nitrospirales bacterium]|nr:DUF948 domain-containing protein [Nitrospirales bacterium]